MNKLLLLGLTLALLVPARLDAHDVGLTSIARVFLDQAGDNQYLLSVIDSNVPPMAGAAHVLPRDCRPLPAQGVDASARVLAFECARPLTFDDVITLPWSLAGVVVLARWNDGTEASAYFRGNGRSVPIQLADLRAGAGSLRRLAGRYFILGCRHILFGIDHLLFILGLLLLVHSFGALVRTVTAFTLAHSLTLGAAVLGFIPVDRAPVEAAIALSIVLLAREIVLGHRGSIHLVHRQPWLVAFVFGLLHGLGFAGALGAIGLRSADIPLALLCFNLGVEAGQISFVIVVLAAAQLTRFARQSRQSLLPRLEPALGYTLGALAMLWLFHRLPAVLAG